MSNTNLQTPSAVAGWFRHGSQVSGMSSTDLHNTESVQSSRRKGFAASFAATCSQASAISLNNLRNLESFTSMRKQSVKSRASVKSEASVKSQASTKTQTSGGPSIIIHKASDPDLAKLEADDFWSAHVKMELSVPTGQALDLAVVFEEFADQLDVLGRAVGGPEVELRSRPSVELDNDTHRPCHGQSYLLKQNYESVLPRRIWQGCFGPQTTLTRGISDAILGSKLNILTSCGKLQVDRAFLQKTVQDVMVGIIQHSSLNCLTKALLTYTEDMEEMYRLALNRNYLIRKKTENRRAIQNAKTEEIIETKRCDRNIWDLEDDRQELLARTGMEQAYVEATGKALTRKSKKVCKSLADKFERRLTDTKNNMKNEFRVHISMMDVLRARVSHLQKLQSYWTDKYEADKEEIQQLLEQIHENRARDLDKIAWLKHTIYNYEEICVDDRRLKAIAEARRVRTWREQKASTYLQAHWRGTMVRRKLGRYRPDRVWKAEQERLAKEEQKKKEEKEKAKQKKK